MFVLNCFFSRISKIICILFFKFWRKKQFKFTNIIYHLTFWLFIILSKTKFDKYKNYVKNKTQNFFDVMCFMRGLTVSMFRHAKNSTLSFSHKGNFTSKVLCEGKKKYTIGTTMYDIWQMAEGPKHVEFSKNKKQLSRKIMKVCVICKEEYSWSEGKHRLKTHKVWN